MLAYECACPKVRLSLAEASLEGGASALVFDPYLIQVTIAQGLHLFPFRTEKLNLATPMVLRKRESR